MNSQVIWFFLKQNASCKNMLYSEKIIHKSIIIEGDAVEEMSLFFLCIWCVYVNIAFDVTEAAENRR